MYKTYSQICGENDKTVKPENVHDFIISKLRKDINHSINVQKLFDDYDMNFDRLKSNFELEKLRRENEFKLSTKELLNRRNSDLIEYYNTVKDSFDDNTPPPNTDNLVIHKANIVYQQPIPSEDDSNPPKKPVSKEFILQESEFAVDALNDEKSPEKEEAVVI